MKNTITINYQYHSTNAQQVNEALFEDRESQYEILVMNKMKTKWKQIARNFITKLNE